jgi:hypothetical protein
VGFEVKGGKRKTEQMAYCSVLDSVLTSWNAVNNVLSPVFIPCDLTETQQPLHMIHVYHPKAAFCFPQLQFEVDQRLL